MNRFISLSLIIISAITFFSCDSTKQLAQTNQTAEAAYQAGDYQKALGLWENIIHSYEHKGASKTCPAYTNAGMAAEKLGQTDKAIDYLKKADYSDLNNEDTYLTLANIYRKKDNLSLELVNLETYLKKFPKGKQTTYANKRLLQLYVESDNLEKAVALWKTLPQEEQQNISNIENYLLINSKLKNNETCLALSKELLQKDNNNVTALNWLANYYFWKAENRYQKELKDYEAHKTRKQYAHLLKALDKVSATYKKSLTYGKRLYKVNPTPATARLLSRCYNRLDDKKKAAYYKKLSK